MFDDNAILLALISFRDEPVIDASDGNLEGLNGNLQRSTVIDSERRKSNGIKANSWSYISVFPDV